MARAESLNLMISYVHLRSMRAPNLLTHSQKNFDISGSLRIPGRFLQTGPQNKGA